MEANSRKKILKFLIVFIIGFGLGIGSYEIFFCRHNTYETLQVRKQGNFKFINPLYECEIGDENLLKKYVPFEDKVKYRIQSEINQSGIQLAYYFRNLNNGPWFGMNEEITYAPASLLKVPIMMAYFNLADKNPEILEQKLIFNRNPENENLPVQQIQSGPPLEDGKKYTVEELIESMIIYSDNEAMALLTENLPAGKLYETYSELGVANPYNRNEDNVITVKDYASFFRILYNSAYLDKEYSEKALDLLSRCSFKGGIPAGVRENVTVAHKFGERELKEGDFRQQFHDCGIIYYEKYPYLLCVMTRGNNRDQLIESIKDISQIVFEEISRNYP